MLVLRAWMEPTKQARLRTRITRTLDVTARQDLVQTVSNSDEVVEVVRSWLDEFLTGARTQPEAGAGVKESS